MGIYRVEEIEIVADCREIRRGDELVRIRPKTVDLLLYLIAHRHRALSKQELLDEIWKGTKVTENSLIQCVIELRRALGDDSQQQRLIKTVAKTGYRFVGPVEEIGPEVRPDVNEEAKKEPADSAPAPVKPERHRSRWLVPSAAAFFLVLIGVLLARTREPVEPALMTPSLEAYRYYSLGVTKAQQFHSKEALDLLQKAVSLDPQFTMAIARIGYTYSISSDRPELGKPYFEKAIALSSHLSEPNRLYLAAWYSMSNRDFEGAIQTFQELLRRYPRETDAYCELTDLLVGEGRLDEAYSAIQKALEVDPASARSYNKLRSIYLSTGRFGEAVVAARRFVGLASTEPNAHDSLGLAYEAKGDFEAAERAYRTALELDPGFEIALVHLGNTLYRQGRYTSAMTTFEQYLKAAPTANERVRAYDYIGFLNLRRGDFTHALPFVAKAAAEDPVHRSITGVLLALARNDLAGADALLARGRTTLERGMQRNQREVLYLLGRDAMAHGDSEEALNYFHQVLRARVPFWDIEWHEDCVADAYLGLGRMEDAIAEYHRVLQLYPNLALVWYHLGEAYDRAGDSASALRATNRFLELWSHADQDIPELVTARRRIGS